MALQSLRGRNDAGYDAGDDDDDVDACHAEARAVTPAGPQDCTERLIAARVNERLFSGAPIALRIGRFTILEELGRGGMGLVYSAYDEQLDRKVAIKVLLEETPDPDAQRRFLREGQAMARIVHSNVVGVHEVGSSDGQPFLAMELVRGQSLAMWLRTRPGWRAIVEAFIQAGQGLVAAHQAGLVHCDLKLNNIMRSDDGVVKILDFGIARAMDGVHANSNDGDATREGVTASGSATSFTAPVTRKGVVAGTPPYMAPEQLSGGNVDARSDQFSFCVALHEALYGERPFHGKSVEELMQEIVDGTIRPAPRDSDVPAAVRKAVLRGLAHDPAKRWPSMDALLERLRRPLAPRSSRAGLSLTLGLLVMIAGLGGARYAASARLEGHADGREGHGTERCEVGSRRSCMTSAAVHGLARPGLLMASGACSATAPPSRDPP